MEKSYRILRMHTAWARMSRSSCALVPYGKFRRVVNYTAADGENSQLWLGDRTCPFGPQALILDIEEIPSALRECESIVLRQQADSPENVAKIAIGGDGVASIALAAQLGQSCAKVLPVQTMGSGEAGVRASRQCMRWLDERGSSSSPFTGAATNGREAAMRARGAGICRILAGMKGQEGGLRQALEAFIGYGPGLTPAADDFLVGALAMSAALDDSLCPHGLLAAIVDEAASRTTLVSQLYLRAAVRGEFSELVVEATQAAIRGALSAASACGRGARPCPEPVNSLLGHGSTSGTDTFAGMAVYMGVWAQAGRESGLQAAHGALLPCG